MTAAPLLSYIVLSYNYEHYIGHTLRSILGQSVQDFEVVVVDDASCDASREVVRSFGDPRIRLLENERNLGGAGSYNRAVAAARGEWLVNLDADDWIAPDKAQLQLEAAAADPRLDIVGTHVSIFDGDGEPHPRAQELEPNFNNPTDLNDLTLWIGRNPLCRSSTMVRRAAHLRIGLDDATMVRAPDYELWTRALREECRFGLVPQRLTFIRVQSTGVTGGDPIGTLLEVTYAMLRNLVPLAEQHAMLPSIQRIVEFVAGHQQLSALGPREAYRLVGATLMGLPPVADFARFRASLADPAGDPALERCGRRCLALLRGESGEKLLRDIEAYIDARDYWQQQAEAAQVARDELTRANDELRRANEAWEAAFRRTTRWRLDQLARRAYSRFFPSS